MNAVVRFFANLGISAGYLWVFQLMGWISFAEGDMIQYVAGAALLTVAITTVLAILYIGLVFATFGLGCLLYPVYAIAIGWFTLLILSSLTGWFEINVAFWWQGLVMSIAYGLIRIHPEIKENSASE